MREASPYALIDACNRRLTYLRISITDRCNLRCAYCLPCEDTPRLDHAEVLRYEEILRIARVGARLGITKLRVTGGEPLVRKGVYDFLAELARIPGIRDLSLTTNGVLLEENIDRIKAAGVTRVNISLDTLRPERYRDITGTDAFARVWAGIKAAQAAGFSPIKINVVAMRGVNDDEIEDMARLTLERNWNVRFIELMPLGELGQDESLRMNNVRFIEERPYLIPLEPRYRGQPSQDFRVEGYKGRVGFISPHSRKFCDLCNRVRVMSDGKLRMCLGNNHEISLMEALEEQDDKALIEIIRDAIYNKPEGHHFDCDFVSDKNMRRIGG